MKSQQADASTFLCQNGSSFLISYAWGHNIGDAVGITIDEPYNKKVAKSVRLSAKDGLVAGPTKVMF
jgi:hypothetical protein